MYKVMVTNFALGEGGREGGREREEFEQTNP